MVPRFCARFMWSLRITLDNIFISSTSFEICAEEMRAGKKNFSKRSATKYALTGNNFHFYVGDEREKQVRWERGELLVN